MAIFCENRNKINLPVLRSLQSSYLLPYVGPFYLGVELTIPVT